MQKICVQFTLNKYQIQVCDKYMLWSFKEETTWTVYS